MRLLFFYWRESDDVNDIELCMKQYDCKRCPQNRICEALYQKEQKEKERNAENLQDVWGGSGRSHLSAQKKPSKERQQTKRHIQKNKAVDKQKHRDKAKG